MVVDTELYDFEPILCLTFGGTWDCKKIWIEINITSPNLFETYKEYRTHTCPKIHTWDRYLAWDPGLTTVAWFDDDFTEIKKKRCNF